MRTSVSAASSPTTQLRSHLLVAVVIGTGLCTAPPAFSQTLSSIDGTVADASGGVIASVPKSQSSTAPRA
jgi:hypothetical protein